MSFEHPENPPIPKAEKEPRFLSLQEIQVKIAELCGQENPEVLRTLEDEKGVYLHEVATVNEAGDASVFSYRRAGIYPEYSTVSTCIEVVYYIGTIEDEMAVGGDTLYDEKV